MKKVEEKSVRAKPANARYRKYPSNADLFLALIHASFLLINRKHEKFIIVTTSAQARVSLSLHQHTPLLNMDKS